MTVQNSTYRADYNGNGSTAAFTVPFYFLDPTHLEVILTDTTTNLSTYPVLNSDFTVAGTGVTAGGTITFSVAPASGVKVSILRDAPYTQLTHFVENDPLPAASLEATLDLLTMQNQQQQEQLGRAIVLDASVTGVDPTLPPSTPSQLLGFDATGAKLTTYPATGTTPAALIDPTVITNGDALVAVKQPATGAIGTTQHAKNKEHISVLDFYANGVSGPMVDPTGVVDSTLGIQAAINYCVANGVTLRLPAGTYKITGTLSIVGRLRMIGDGNQTTIIELYTNSAAVYAISVACPDNFAMVGMDIGGFGLVCGAGSTPGSGINILTTATNSAVSQSVFHDIFISNVSTGVRLYGVIYMCSFRGITVSGGVTAYGWWSANGLIYNSFDNLEVTDCRAGSYAYYMDTGASQMRNITADACCYFGGSYTHIQGLNVEGMPYTAAAAYVINLNQIQSLSDVAIINVPNATCGCGINVQGNAVSINNVRTPDSGAGNQPNKMFNLTLGGTGTISNCKSDRAIVRKLEADHSDAVLAGYVITACSDITDKGLSYAQGTWTPGFTGFSPNPSVISAQYTRIGRQITATIYCSDGVATAGSTITGLPVAANSTQGAAASGGCGDTTKRISGSVTPNATAISNIPANTLTGQYWQMTVTYFI